MEIYVESLTGTCFELIVSPFETILSVKTKIQRLEGIPVSQQHLVWQNNKLDDDTSLKDYGITTGCTLKLVLAMRGGPINTRRIGVEDELEMEGYLDTPQVETPCRSPKYSPVSSLHDKSTSKSDKNNHQKQVTLLLYRDGEQLNFFRVVDRGDGTLTPCSDTASVSSKDDFASHIPPAKLPSSYKEQVNKMRRIMENKITANKMALVRSKLASHEQPKKKLFSHLEADKVKNNFDVCKRNKKLESTSINNERDKSGLPVQDSLKVDNVQPKQHVISNGILSLQLENKHEIMNPKPPPSAKPVNQVRHRKLKGLYGSTLQDSLDLKKPDYDEGTMLNEVNAPTYSNYEKTPNSEVSASVMKRLSTASSNEIQLNRDDTDEFDTTKLLDDSPLHNPIKKPSKLRLNRHDLYLQSYGINMAKPSKSLYGYLDEQQPKNPLPPLGISFDQNTSFDVKKESPTCENSPNRDNLTSASKNTESFLHNNCFTHTSHQKTAVNEEKENCSDFEEDNFQQYSMKNRIEKSFLDRHRKKLNYKTYSPLPKTPTKHLNNYVQHTTFNQSSWDNFSISREVQEHKQMLNLLNEKMKRKMGLKTSNKMFNIENEGKLLQPIKHASFVKKDSKSSLLQKSLPHSSTVVSTKPRILPPLNSLKSKKRCYLCGKRTGLASSYTCRCGLNFCAQHRYAEAHNCTHDYKSQGRKVLQGNNPLVRAPKLPKI